jgi:hypothetical protein
LCKGFFRKTHCLSASGGLISEPEPQARILHDEAARRRRQAGGELNLIAQPPYQFAWDYSATLQGEHDVAYPTSIRLTLFSEHVHLLSERVQI